MTMTWYYTVRGAHTHVRVFTNGAASGELVFRNEEFKALRRLVIGLALPFMEIKPDPNNYTEGS